MRSVREILDAQRFLQRYADEPIETISKEQALKNLKRLGILTDSGEIAPEYVDIVCKQTEIEKGNRKMDKTINMTFKSCMVDGDQLIEDDGKNEPLYHDIAAIFKQLDGETGLTITIKKTEKSGEIHAV